MVDLGLEQAKQNAMFRRGQLFERDSIAIMLNSVDVYKMKDGELVLMTADEMRRHIYKLVLQRE